MEQNAQARSPRPAAPAWRRKLGWTLFAVWAALFFGGALGELLGIEFLRDVTDVKRLFLR